MRELNLNQLICPFLFSLFVSFYASAQVGIGTTDPKPEALLDIESEDGEQGILIPRVNIHDLSTLEPVTTGTATESLLVYNTNTTTGKGFYYWNGTDAWIPIGGTNSRDWYEEGTTTVPDNINDNIYTNGEVGIGLNNPNAPLHIWEANGTAPSGNDGTLVLEHDDNGGTSSIVFKSAENSGNDYGYISYSDDGSPNGSTNENSLLEIGIQNDPNGGFSSTLPYIDDIRVNSSGSFLVNTGGNERMRVTPEGQVLIGTTNATASASLELGANNKGFLPNKVSLVATNQNNPITNPATGLLVYNVATSGSGGLAVSPGYYYWNGTKWSRIQAEESSPVESISLTNDIDITGSSFNTISGTSLTFVARRSSVLVNMTASGHGAANAIQNVYFRIRNITTGSNIGGTKTNAQNHTSIYNGYWNNTYTTRAWNVSFSRLITGLTIGEAYTLVVQGRVESILGSGPVEVDASSDDASHLTLYITQ